MGSRGGGGVEAPTIGSTFSREGKGTGGDGVAGEVEGGLYGSAIVLQHGEGFAGFQ